MVSLLDSTSLARPPLTTPMAAATPSTGLTGSQKSTNNFISWISVSLPAGSRGSADERTFVSRLTLAHIWWIEDSSSDTSLLSYLILCCSTCWFGGLCFPDLDALWHSPPVSTCAGGGCSISLFCIGGSSLYDLLSSQGPKAWGSILFTPANGGAAGFLSHCCSLSLAVLACLHDSLRWSSNFVLSNSFSSLCTMSSLSAATWPLLRKDPFADQSDKHEFVNIMERQTHYIPIAATRIWKEIGNWQSSEWLIPLNSTSMTTMRVAYQMNWSEEHMSLLMNTKLSS